MALQPREIAQEADVPELVQLVGTDRAVGGALQIPGHVRGRAREEGESRARERHLRGRGEHEGPVGMAGLGAEVEDRGNGVAAPGQVVHRGQLIALASDNGAPDGCHLHFEKRTPGGGLDSATYPKGLLDLSPDVP